MIEKFSGKYRFLSNFYRASVIYEGIQYPSVEHAYQAAKTLSETERKFIKKLRKPVEAKRAGKKVRLRANWESIKKQVMEELVRDKFTRHAHLKVALLKTGDVELQEGNTWNDYFWGVDLKTKHGQNNLGKILMKVRDELRK